MKYHFKVHKEKSGLWAESLEPGLNVNSQGDSLSELLENLKDALDLAFDEPENSKWIPPSPDSSFKGKSVVEIAISPKIALATVVRVMRLRQGWSQRKAADKLGIKHISQYQKLESGKTANPEFGTMVKLKELYPGLSIDEVMA